MQGRLLLLVFITVVACNSFAAVTPHADGEGGCSTACCRNAREGNGSSGLSRLRCLMNCEQSAAPLTASRASAFAGEKQNARTPGIAIFAMETARSRNQLNIRRLLPAPARASLSLYLQTGSLLI